MFIRKKKFAELEKRVEALESKVDELLNKENEQSSLGETESKKEASYSVIVDEWLNGKKEGGK